MDTDKRRGILTLLLKNQKFKLTIKFPKVEPKETKLMFFDDTPAAGGTPTDAPTEEMDKDEEMNGDDDDGGEAQV